MRRPCTERELGRTMPLSTDCSTHLPGQHGWLQAPGGWGGGIEGRGWVVCSGGRDRVRAGAVACNRRWTMTMQFWPLPWRPNLIFTGRSIYQVGRVQRCCKPLPVGWAWHRAHDPSAAPP